MGKCLKLLHHPRPRPYFVISPLSSAAFFLLICEFFEISLHSHFPVGRGRNSSGQSLQSRQREDTGEGGEGGRPTDGRAGFGRTVELREGGRKEGGRTIPPPRIHNVCHDDDVVGGGGGGRFELRSHTNRFLPLGSLLPLPPPTPWGSAAQGDSL